MNDWLPLLIALLIGLSAALLIGLWHASFLEVFRQIFVRPLHLLASALDVLRDARAAVLRHASTLRAEDGLVGTSVMIQRIFGSLLLTGLTLIFVGNDIHLANIWFEGYGMVAETTGAVDWMAGWDLNTIIAAGICAAYVMGGAYVMDLLGVTHLVRHRATRVYRIFAAVVVSVILIMALSVTLAMGYDRGVEVLDTPAATAADPQGGSLAALLDAPIPTDASPASTTGVALAVFIGHAALMTLCTLVSLTGLVQVPILFWLLLLVLPLTVLTLLRLPLMLLHALAQWIAGVAVTTVQFILQWARLLSRTPGRWLGPDWCETHLPVGAPAPWASVDAEAESQASGGQSAPAGPTPWNEAESHKDDFGQNASTRAPAPDPASTSRNWDPYNEPGSQFAADA